MLPVCGPVPEIPGLPHPDTVDYPQWIIGYQYFGGVYPMDAPEAVPALISREPTVPSSWTAHASRIGA